MLYLGLCYITVTKKALHDDISTPTKKSQLMTTYHSTITKGLSALPKQVVNHEIYLRLPEPNQLKIIIYECDTWDKFIKSLEKPALEPWNVILYPFFLVATFSLMIMLCVQSWQG